MTRLPPAEELSIYRACARYRNLETGRRHFAHDPLYRAAFVRSILALRALPKTIDVSGEGLHEHVVGDKDCREGWCSIHGYPKPCQCGGLVHADFADEDMDCNYWLHTKCDRCGKPE